LVPGPVAVAPAGGGRRRVRSVEGAMPLPEPAAEVLRRAVAVARGDVAAVLVVHVPERERGVVAVALGQLLDQRGGCVSIAGARRAVLLTGPRPEPDAVARDGQALRIVLGEPRRRRGRCRRQIRVEAIGV